MLYLKTKNKNKKELDVNRFYNFYKDRKLISVQ